MTYGQFLIVFLLAPIAGLALLVLRDRADGRVRERQWRGRTPLALLAGLIVVAMAYTIPWDNHLIAQGVWRYDPSLVGPVRLGWIPLEEVLFFPLQTTLVWLWVIWLIPRVAARDPGVAGAAGMGGHWSARGDAGVGAVPSKRSWDWSHPPRRLSVRGGRAVSARWMAAASGAAVWLVALAILARGWQPGTYVAWELGWALPPLILQVGLGGDVLWRRRRLLFSTLAPVVLYLSVADAIAIHDGIWAISPHRSLDLLLAGALPLEELIFFLLTTALVACGLILGGAPEVRSRLPRRVSNALAS